LKEEKRKEARDRASFYSIMKQVYFEALFSGNKRNQNIWDKQRHRHTV